MPVYITPQKVKMRQLSGNNSDQFYGLDVVAAETTAEHVAAINGAADTATSNINSTINTAITNANAKENELNSKVTTIQNALTSLKTSLEIQGHEFPIDSELITAGAAADAKVTGDAIGNLKSAVNGIFSESSTFITNLTSPGISPSNGKNSTNNNKRRTLFIPINSPIVLIRKLSTVYKWTIWTYSGTTVNDGVRSLTSNSVAQTSTPIILVRGENDNYFRIGFERADGQNITAEQETDIKNNTFICTLTDKTLTKENVPADAKAVGDALATATETLNNTIEAANNAIINVDSEIRDMIDTMSWETVEDISDNLFWIAPYTITSNGITCTYNPQSGIINLNGTATGNVIIPIRGIEKRVPSGTYVAVLSTVQNTESISNNFSLRYGDYTTGIGTRWVNNSNKNVTVSIGESDFVFMYVTSGTVCDNVQYKIKLNANTEQIYTVGGFASRDAALRYFSRNKILTNNDDMNQLQEYAIYSKDSTVTPANWPTEIAKNVPGTIINLMQPEKSRGLQFIVTKNNGFAYRIKSNNIWNNYIIISNGIDYAMQRGRELLEEARPIILNHNYDRRCINFAFITDTHFGGTRSDLYEARHNIQLFADFANEKFMDFAVHGGDLITDYDTNLAEAIDWIDDTTSILNKIQIPTFITLGNHEENMSYVKVQDTTSLDWNNNKYFTWDDDHVELRETNSNKWNNGKRPLWILNETTTTYVKIEDYTNLDWINNTYFMWDDDYVELQETTYNEWNSKKLPLWTSDSSQFISPFQQELLCQNNVEGKHTDPTNPLFGGYFYRDFEDLKLRVIVLNRYPVEYIADRTPKVTRSTLTKYEARWLANDALVFKGVKTDYQNWKVLIFSHDKLDKYVEDMIAEKENPNETAMRKVLRAFIGTTDVDYATDPDTGTMMTTHFHNYNQQGQDQGQGKGNFIALIHGHNHKDMYEQDSYDGIHSISCTCGFCSKYPDLLSPTKNAFAFSVFTVDTVDHKIYETRIGKWNDPDNPNRNTNRSWNYLTGVELT